MSNNVFQNIQLQRIADSMQGGGSSVTVNIDVTGAGDMQGATASAAGAHGLVPAPAAGDEGKVLTGAGTWAEMSGGGASALTDLTDVDITSPTSGESLKYDGSKWVNGNVTTELPDFIEETSGNIVTVEAAERPAKSLKVAINPVQSGSGDPSPDNIRPISGWTGCNVVVSPTTDAQDGQTYNIHFPSEAGTVYGGTLDVTTGVLTVTMAEVDLGTLTWVYIASNKIFFTTINDKKPSIYEGAVSQYANGSWWGEWADKDCVWCGNAANDGFVVKDTRFTDAATFKSAMSGVQFCYELATPQTYQLTPTEVQMLLGTNNIWADTGEITELRYIPQTYDDLIKEVSGGGGAVFIDTDNIIVSLTELPSSVVNYTATEDCYLYVQLGGQNIENYVTINGAQIFYSQGTSWQQESGLIPLAKGQTAEIHGRQTNDYYAVYGVK
jgi:hypothetical protein